MWIFYILDFNWRYEDSADNTAEENSSIFLLILVSLLWARECSKTSFQQNYATINWCASWHCPVYTHTHTTVLLLFWNMSRTTWVSRYQKGKTWQVKTNLDLLEQEIVSGSGICWAICKVCTSSQTTTQHPTTQFFTGRMPFLPPNQQRQSTEGKTKHWSTFPMIYRSYENILNFSHIRRVHFWQKYVIPPTTL